MPTAMKPSSFDFETLQQSIDAQGEQIRTLVENLSRISDRSHLAEVAEQVARLGELLSRVEERLSRGEQILTTLEEYQFGMIAGDTEVLKQIKDRRLASQLRETLQSKLQAGATALVISKGDESLFASDWLNCWHFPQDTNGDYSGFHPADSGSAIIQLEALRAKGADYLVIPCTSLWWLDYYKRFRDYLHHRYREFHCEDDVCVIYALREASRGSETNVWTAFEDLLIEVERRIQRDPAILDWATDCELREKFPCRTIFSPPFQSSPTSEPRLPYLDQTIDIVAISSSDPAVILEARRVAQIAVLEFDLESSEVPTFEIQWRADRRPRSLASASIIIPTYNGISLTEDCIRALQENLPTDFRGEIIVVDNNSADDTVDRMQQLVKQDGRIRFFRNPQNIGFIGSCNRGAREASGDVLVFLNNDTLPQPGWLEPLLKIFDEYPDAGAVGGKLVYPDGRLQEAGGLIFSDGSAANFGRGDFELDAPLYNYFREVDYVTGALIVTPRKLFEKLGGLDQRYQPAYYEETDYCVRLREAGFKVYYQPESVVIHLEGMTNGTDGSTGEKRYQLVNQQKFAQRWREVLRRQPDNPQHFDSWTWYALAVRDEREPNTNASCELHNGDMKVNDLSPTKRKTKRAK
jgi:GT2 family glycosyltransferase